MLKKHVARLETGSVRDALGTIDYTVTRSVRRRKSISISVGSGGEVRVAAPVATSNRFISEVVAKRAGWIRKRCSEVASRSEPRQFESGDTIFCRGREMELRVLSRKGARARVERIKDRLVVSLPQALPAEQRSNAIERAIVAWFRREAVRDIELAVRNWSVTMNLKPTSVLVRDQKRRWGSCAPDGTLRFNWRLVMVEPALLEFVVVHELAHLVERNHSPAFWAVVERHLPDYRDRRRRLRETSSQTAM